MKCKNDRSRTSRAGLLGESHCEDIGSGQSCYENVLKIQKRISMLITELLMGEYTLLRTTGNRCRNFCYLSKLIRPILSTNTSYCESKKQKSPEEPLHALRGNRTPGGSMATTQVTTTPLMRCPLTTKHKHIVTINHYSEELRKGTDPRCNRVELSN